MLLNDLRYGGRRLVASPGFSLVAVVTLALGIGTTTAIYSIADALILRPLPYPNPERLVDLAIRRPGSTNLNYFEPDQVRALKNRTDLFSSIDGFIYASGTIEGGDEPLTMAGAAVGGAMMRTLGMRPRLGRWIEETDTQPGRESVIVLSEDTWRKRFAAAPDIVGRSIRLNNRSFDVIGVMPRDFRYPTAQQEFWIPLTPTDTSGQRLLVTARLPDGVPVAEAQTRIHASALDAPTAPPGAPSQLGLRIVPPRAKHLNVDERTAIYLICGAVVLVLLIACANVANLLLVQNAARDREIAVRTALGATRGNLVKQLLAETMMLAVAGGVFGLVVAQWVLDLIMARVPSTMGFLDRQDVTLDSRSLVFALGLTAVTGIICGVLPALKGSKMHPQEALKAGARAATGTPRQERLRRAFVVAQLAVSVILLVGAALLVRTFLNLVHVDPGFDARNLALVKLQLPSWKYPNGQARETFYDTLLDRFRALPGVAGVTMSGGAPPAGGNLKIGLTAEVEGRGVVFEDRRLLVPYTAVNDDFFSIMKLPLKAGRTFSVEDHPGAPRAVIVNESFAARVWQDQNPIGQRVRMGFGANEPWSMVVGVVGNVYQFDYAEPSGQPAYYVSRRQVGTGSVQTIALRTADDARGILASLREQVRALDPQQPIWKIEAIESAYQEFFALPRFYTVMLSAFSSVGLIIAAVGLYGVLAYAIAQRTREFGIRLALGAQTVDVMRLVLESGGVVTGLGLLLGVAGSLVGTRALGSLLIGVPRLDPAAYLGVAITLAVVALIACWIPARRATKVDPIVALRYE